MRIRRYLRKEKGRFEPRLHLIHDVIEAPLAAPAPASDDQIDPGVAMDWRFFGLRGLQIRQAWLAALCVSWVGLCAFTYVVMNSQVMEDLAQRDAMPPPPVEAVAVASVTRRSRR